MEKRTLSPAIKEKYRLTVPVGVYATVSGKVDFATISLKEADALYAKGFKGLQKIAEKPTEEATAKSKK